MDIYNFMKTYLPTVYKGSENSDKQLKVYAAIFQDIYDKIELIPTYFYIDTATEEALDLLGKNIGRIRGENEDLEVYRAILKIKYYGIMLTPTHDNLLRVTEKTSGLYPYLKPLWELQGIEWDTQTEGNQTDLAYYISYDLDSSYPNEILDELENLYPAGVKLIRDYLYKLEHNDLIAACFYNDYQVIHVSTEYGYTSIETENFENTNINGYITNDDNIISIGFIEEV